MSGAPGGPIRVMTMLDRPDRLGGAETVAVAIARGLDPSRFERWLCVTRWSDALRDDPATADLLAGLEADGVRVLGIPRRSRADVLGWRRLALALREERIDVLHAHLFGSNVWASIVGRAAGVPVVVAHDHNWSFDGKAWRRVIDRFVIGRRCDAFVTVSDSSRRAMIEVEGVPAAKTAVIRNGIPDVPAGDRDEARRSLGIPPDAPVAGTVAVLRPEKALEVLVEAAARLAADVPGLRVVIVGDGVERDRLERLAREGGAGEALVFAGLRRDVPELLAALDLAVCCSDWEGHPLSVLEYMRAGLPTVATRVGGLPELIRDGEDGVLVPRRDPGALAGAVADLLADDERRRRLGEAARARQQAEFSDAAMLAAVEGLYDRLWQRRGSS